MARAWRSVKVFISSTFRDMHAERDHLIKVVFPALREKLEPHRIHLVDIDLRWGVTAEQADNDRVLELCLDQIKHSRPFFIGILGQRYGWVPGSLPDAAVRKFPWVQGQPGKSITELEILHGVLNDPSMRMHSMFYFRKDDYLASVPREVMYRVFLDEHGDKLKAVKEAIRRHCRNYGAPLTEYPCGWDPNKANQDGTRGGIVGLSEFGEKLKGDLLAAMGREYPEMLKEPPPPARPGTGDWLVEEQDFHERFMESRLQVYVGREKVHQRLMAYLEGDSTKPLLVSGGSGTGKSSILARLHEAWSESHPDCFLLPHFVGASPSSTDIRKTLRRFCLALRGRFMSAEAPKGGEGSPEGERKAVAKEVPEELERLKSAFPEFLQAVPEGGRAVFIIDAVNQFDDYGDSQDMAWLPDSLPPGTRIVVSCIEEPEREQAALAALRGRSTTEMKVEPLTDEERFEIVAQVPSISAKSLDPRQTAFLLDNPATINPLYLTVALEELRGFGSFEKLNERIRSFPRTEGEKGLDELFLQVIDRLAGELGQDTVFALLSSIATGRNGLSEPELAEFLDRIKIGREGRARRSAEMLVALRQLRPYLLRRGPYVDFYHRNLYKAVRQRYLSREDVRTGVHRALAEYFLSKGLKSERMLSETPHHLSRAGMWDRLEGLLTDLRFVEAKCAAGMTYELVADYGAALRALPDARQEGEKELERLERVERYAGDLIAFAKGGIPSLEIIPSVRPWTEEELEAGAERIKKNPSGLDRVRAFSQFADSEAHVLDKFASWPGFCIQHAYNCVDSGPVGEAAERGVGSETEGALVLSALPYRRAHNPCPGLLRTLEGHAGTVRAVAVTPDGRRALSAGVDKTLRLWDLEAGRCLRTLAGHADVVAGLGMTPDGKKAVSGSHDKTMRVWDLDAGCCSRTLEGHAELIGGVAITPDGRIAVSASEDKTLRVWDVPAGRCLATLHGHADAVHSVAVAPRGERAVSAGEDGTLRVWDLKGGCCLRTLEGHEKAVFRVAMTPDGGRAVSGSGDGGLKVWDLETGRCLRTWTGHEPPGARDLAVTPDGARAVSAGFDQSLRVWDLETGRLLRVFEGHAGWVLAVAVTPDARRAVSGGNDKTLRVWDIEAGRCLPKFGEHAYTNWISAAAFLPGAKKAVSACWTELRLWDVDTGRCLQTLEGHTLAVNDARITPDGKKAVSASDDGTLRVWDLETGRCLHTLHEFGGVQAVAITPDGKRAVSASANPSLRVWDMGTGRCLRTLAGHAKGVTSVVIAPDGRRAVSASSDRLLRVWDIEAGTCLRTLEGHAHEALVVAITPDGKRAVSAGWDETLRLWDITAGVCLRTLTQQGRAREIAITPDGRRAVAENPADGGLCAWDLETGACPRRPEGQRPLFRGVAVGPDGRSAVSWGWDDGVLRAWRLETGRCVAVYQGRGHVRAVAGLTGDGMIAAGVENAFIALTLRNLRMETPLVTPARLWLFADGEGPGRWEDCVQASCSWCGRRFPVPDGTLGILDAIARKAGLAPGDSPCARLPAEAWEEPGLAAECPHCRKRLRFNPFCVDIDREADPSYMAR